MAKGTDVGFGSVLEALRRTDTFGKALAALSSDRRARIGGLWGSSFSLAVAALAEHHGGSCVVVTPTVDDVEDLQKDLQLLGVPPESIHPLAAVESGDGVSLADPRLLSRNLRTLRSRLPGSSGGIMLLPLPCAVRPVLAPERLEARLLDVRQGQEIDRDEWLEQFGEAGLERVDLVSGPGEFSVRGGIVDLFPYSDARPVRVELDGDWIDSIRRIDPSTQRSIATLESVIVPLIGRDDLVDPDLDPANLLRYIGADDLVIVRNPPELFERLERYDVDERVERFLRGEGDRHSRLEAEALPTGDLADGDADAARWVGNFSVGSITAEGADLTSALGLVERLARSSERVLLFCQSEAEGRRFQTVLSRQLESGLDKIEIVHGDLAHGFQFHDIGLTMVDHHELFHRVRPKRREIPEAAPSLPIDDHLQLAKGDYVVHALHGIARYRGLERMQSGETEQDFLHLEFAKGMTLYVPIAKIHWIERYIGSKGRDPRLSTLGGTGWANKRKLVEDSVTEFAGKLLRVMAIRSRKSGISFGPDTEWQHEFEAAFPYKDTPDQHEAATLAKRDMESSSPMDRLICGDVGYGKTEIAMRAAFKAVEAGRQVGVLVPTTVLAAQHLQSFRERMSDYPVEIDMLSRFRSGKEIRQTLERTKNGHVDILIGTHRLLSKDVQFKDLGLIIVDEEQRFGVGDKERLMNFRATVDLLTLTATPIPRTLHMAMVNLRDISTLETPPQGRQAIHTRIMPWHDDTIKEAIEFELERDGQVFFIHNRVKTIERMTEKLQRMVPTARIDYVHGQMDEHLVEERMTRFVEGKIDVLVATTIIESGLDIPNANTMFIDRADRFGLAELHQLRGRVGRYKQRAVAYLLVPPRAAISTEARKRLKAIEEFSDLGAGFRIAMRDLEIRGSGNLLGPEQHGHIAAVGYELYCRLLRDAVKRLRGETVDKRVETDMDFGVAAFIPADYIPDTRQKVEIYQKIAKLEDVDGIAALRDECRDRFGPLPEELANLFEVTRARQILQKNQVTGIRRRGSRLIVDVPLGYTPPGLADRPKDEVRRVDGKTIHLLLPPELDDIRLIVDGLVRALRGEGFF